MNELKDADSVRALYGEPSHISRAKQLDHLDQHCKGFIELSPFVVVATVDAGGRLEGQPVHRGRRHRQRNGQGLHHRPRWKEPSLRGTGWPGDPRDCARFQR